MFRSINEAATLLVCLIFLLMLVAEFENEEALYTEDAADLWLLLDFIDFKLDK